MKMINIITYNTINTNKFERKNENSNVQIIEIDSTSPLTQEEAESLLIEARKINSLKMNKNFDNQEKSPFGLLNYDLIQVIVSMLDPKDQINLSQTCQRIYSFCKPYIVKRTLKTIERAFLNFVSEHSFISLPDQYNALSSKVQMEFLNFLRQTKIPIFKKFKQRIVFLLINSEFGNTKSNNNLLTSYKIIHRCIQFCELNSKRRQQLNSEYNINHYVKRIKI